MAGLNAELNALLEIVRAAGPGGPGRIPGFALTLVGDTANLEAAAQLQPRSIPSDPPRHRMSSNASVGLGVPDRHPRDRRISAPDDHIVTSQPQTYAQAVDRSVNDRPVAPDINPVGGAGELSSVAILRRPQSDTDAGPSEVDVTSATSSEVSRGRPRRRHGEVNIVPTQVTSGASPQHPANAPMRRIMATPATLNQVMFPTDQSQLAAARTLTLHEARRPPGPTSLTNRSLTIQASWSSWLAAWYMLLQVSEDAALRFNSGIAYITIVGVNYTIFNIISLEEILASLPSLQKITFGNGGAVPLIEIDALRPGTDSGHRSYSISQATLLVTDWSFPPGSVETIMTRRTHLPTPNPAGWLVLSRTRCNLDGSLGLALGTNLSDMPLTDRMCSIETKKTWEFKDFYDVLQYCTQDRQLPWQLMMPRARLEFRVYTIIQLEKLCGTLTWAGIGHRELVITMSPGSPSSCSLYAFLQREFWIDWIINNRIVTISLWAAELGSAESISRWAPITIDGPSIHNQGSVFTLRLHLPPNKSSPNDSSMGEQYDEPHLAHQTWTYTHWLMVDWLVRAVEFPSLVKLEYVSQPHETFQSTEARLKTHFRQWWLSLSPQQLRYDNRLAQWKDFCRFDLIVPLDRGRAKDPLVLDRLCLWCFIVTTVEPGRLSMRCYADCASRVHHTVSRPDVQIRGGRNSGAVSDVMPARV